MFEIGFWELVLVAIIGIVVVGPKRLPEVVRTLGLLLRKMRRTISSVRADIERELDLEEMRKLMSDVDEPLKKHVDQLNQSIWQAEYDLRQGGKSLLKMIDEPPYQEPPPAAHSVQTDAEAYRDTGIEPADKSSSPEHHHDDAAR